MRAPVWEMNEVILAWKRTPSKRKASMSPQGEGRGVCEICRARSAMATIENRETVEGYVVEGRQQKSN